jgi:hypothetical protein
MAEEEPSKPRDPPSAAELEQQAREERAKRLRERIDQIVEESREPTESDPAESPREFIKRRMRELDDEEKGKQ